MARAVKTAGVAVVFLCGGLGLQACAMLDEASTPERPVASPPQPVAALPASIGEAKRAPVPVAAAPALRPPALATFVGRKVGQLGAELDRLREALKRHEEVLQRVRGQTAANSNRYHGTIASVNARLQIGTTPGNPELVKQWDRARTLLAEVDGDVSEMNALSNDVAASSALAAHLLETTRSAYGLSGAVDEDHRRLSALEDEVNRAVVSIERLAGEVSGDINRQTAYLARERANLTTLSLAIKSGQLLGANLARLPFSGNGGAQGEALSAAERDSSRPLVVIRFDRPNVDYEQPLYDAVKQALDRRPDAAFDLVAVSPGGGNAAELTVAANRSKRNAEAVLRSLSDMGMPADRMRLSAVTSNDAAGNEVHVYLR